ncbi:AbiH family protein [Aquimarina celericrescens]|uniref:AbiH family protein n=1 Tax=Aquimarina celericrescens TaxID=1964542 RepID=A0ABW5AS99_9FLAO|nr:hypothetical protein [Aquimarina celericrescens]
MFKSENIIVILGNGFDLAHDLPTSYSDFSDYIVSKIITPEIFKCIYNANYNSILLKDDKVRSLKSNPDYLINLQLKNYLREVKNSEDLNRIIVGIFGANHDISHVITNNFLGEIYASKEHNWFNIENEYFDRLLNISHRSNRTTPIEKKSDLKRLNKEFEMIKSWLKTYLEALETSLDKSIRNFFDYHFNNGLVKNIYLLIFNYTNTISHYLPFFKKDKFDSIRLNFIHGKSNEEIIFGYGNDQSKEYQQLLSTEIDEYIQNFKTFGYGKNNRYSELLEAIEGFNNYEVLNLGHSLGLTDKTILEEIFNNPACTKIHLAKRSDLEGLEKQNAFMTNFFAASRIIANDKRLRRVVASYESATSFPLNNL